MSFPLPWRERVRVRGNNPKIILDRINSASYTILILIKMGV